MSRPSPAHGAPRARREPVRTPDDALAIVQLARSSAPRDEIIAFLLDDSMRGLGQVIVLTEVHHPADVLRLAEHVAESAFGPSGLDVGDATWMVIASVRHTTADVDPGASMLDDVDLWEQLSDLVDACGISLLEWFVVYPNGPSCPREVIGEPDRWPR